MNLSKEIKYFRENYLIIIYKIRVMIMRPYSNIIAMYLVGIRIVSKNLAHIFLN
jgi:hypothetical protein